MKHYKNKSGLYFRGINQNTNKIDSICFEELTPDEQIEYMNERSLDWHKAMVIRLCETINEMNNE